MRHSPRNLLVRVVQREDHDLVRRHLAEIRPIVSFLVDEKRTLGIHGVKRKFRRQCVEIGNLVHIDQVVDDPLLVANRVATTQGQWPVVWSGARGAPEVDQLDSLVVVPVKPILLGKVFGQTLGTEGSIVNVNIGRGRLVVPRVFRLVRVLLVRRAASRSEDNNLVGAGEFLDEGLDLLRVCGL